MSEGGNTDMQKDKRRHLEGEDEGGDTNTEKKTHRASV
jgi:hypothetical protein